MFEAVYEFKLKQNDLEALKGHWKTLSSYMMAQPRGALSSTLYYSPETETCVIHSRWPSAEIKQANWPLPTDAPAEIHTASKLMQKLYQSPVTVSNPNIANLKADLEQRKIKLCEEVGSPKKNIVIYNDDGAGSRSVYHVFNNLHKAIDPSCRILVVDGNYFTKTNWETTTRLVIIGGGRARPYYETFGTVWESKQVPAGEIRKIKNIGIGNQRITDFVENGGSYLGICAGGYYGAKVTAFELGNALEVYDPGLGLGDYVATGPAYGLEKFRYGKEDGAQLAKIYGKICASNQLVYFNGGCYFEPSPGAKHSEENVLLRYADISGNPAAVIQTAFGKGSVILAGIHPEFIPEKNASTDQLIDQLSLNYPRNQEITAQMFNRLGVPLNEEMDRRVNLAKPQTAFARTHHKITGSTQDDLPENAGTLFQKTNQVVVTADEQTKGRGTQNRKWASPPDVNVYATFGIKLPISLNIYSDILNSPALMEIMALAVVKTLEDYGLKPKLKWRNDTLLNGKKISGILCEIKPTSAGLIALIGIGVNVNMSKEICDSLDQPVTSMAVEAGRPYDKEEVFNRLAHYVSHYINLYLKEGFSSCIPEINARLAFVSKTIRIKEKFTEKELEGICLGVDEVGQLKLQLPDGEINLIKWGDIIKNPQLQKEEQETQPLQPQPVQKSSLLFHLFALGAAGFIFSALSKIYEKNDSADNSSPSPVPRPSFRRQYSTMRTPLPSLKNQSAAIFPLSARAIAARKTLSLTRTAIKGLTRR